MELTCRDCQAKSRHRLSWMVRAPYPRCRQCGHEFRATHQELRALRAEAEDLEREDASDDVLLPPRFDGFGLVAVRQTTAAAGNIAEKMIGR